jgi:hypothetical protein
MITGITYLGFGILTLIAQYFLFQKMGMPGWKGLIPIYSSYLLFKELLSTRHFAAYAGSLVASSVCNSLVTTGVVTAAVPSMILMGVSIATAILALILLIQVLHRLSRSFGHGAGFTFGLVVIEPIMMMILGFGSRQYEKVVA